MKKNILLILALILISSISTSFANSPGTPTVEKKEHIDIGSYDIWLHADGVTWQKNVKPGSTINHNPTIKIPVDDSKNPKNFKVEFLSNPYDVPNDYRKYSVSSGNLVDFEYLGNGQLSFKLNTKLVSHGNEGRGFDVKEYDWQAGAVEGWRFYIPTRITWEYEIDENLNTGGFAISHQYSDYLRWWKVTNYNKSEQGQIVEDYHWTVIDSKFSKQYTGTDENELWEKLDELYKLHNLD